MKSGNLNFLEPFGPLQACNGTALPLPLLYHYVQLNTKDFIRSNHKHQYCKQYLKTRVPIPSKLTYDIFYLYSFTFLCLIQSPDDDG
jgi:hypothetical protein